MIRHLNGVNIDSPPSPTALRRPAASAARTGRARPWFVVLLTSAAIAVYFPSQYLTQSLSAAADSGTGLASTYARDAAWVHVFFYLHITTAGLALLIGPLQFSRRLRARAPRVHRWIGRTYVSAVGLAAVAALVMSFFNSVAIMGFFAFGALAVLWAWTTYRGYSAIRSGDVASHQAWMIRSFALTYAAVTLRLWLVLFLVVLHVFASGSLSPEEISRIAYAPVPFLCWLPNIVVAEILVRRRGLPGLRMVTLATPALNRA